MAPVMDFDALSGLDSQPTCEFKLGGRVWHVRNRNALPFNVVEGALTGEKVKIRQIFESLLVPDEADDFLAMLDDPRSPMTVANYQAVLDFVMEKITKRPTGRPSSSGDGSRATGRSSKGASSSAAMRRRRSTA